MKLIANSREAGVAVAFLLYAAIIWSMTLSVPVDPIFSGAVSHAVGVFLIVLAVAAHWSFVLAIYTAMQKKGDDIAVTMALAYAGATLTFALVADFAAGVLWAAVVVSAIGATGSIGPLSILRVSEKRLAEDVK